VGGRRAGRWRGGGAGWGATALACVRAQVYDVLRTRPGWVETESETEWDFQWAERDWVYESFDTMHLDGWQRMNHYRNGREVRTRGHSPPPTSHAPPPLCDRQLCRKDLLAKNVKRCRRLCEKEGKSEGEAGKYDFTPVTFILPGDYALFVEEFKRPQHAGAVWIMKPIARRWAGERGEDGLVRDTELARGAPARRDQPPPPPPAAKGRASSCSTNWRRSSSGRGGRAWEEGTSVARPRALPTMPVCARGAQRIPMEARQRGGRGVRGAEVPRKPLPHRCARHRGWRGGVVAVRPWPPSRLRRRQEV
jgi:hypothetical protein